MTSLGMTGKYEKCGKQEYNFTALCDHFVQWSGLKWAQLFSQQSGSGHSVLLPAHNIGLS